MPAGVESDDPKALRQERGEHREAARVVPHAVREHQWVRGWIAPLEQVEAYTQRFHGVAAFRRYGASKARLTHDASEDTRWRRERKPGAAARAATIVVAPLRS
jgi:hypothetical protein